MSFGGVLTHDFLVIRADSIASVVRIKPMIASNNIHVLIVTEM